MRTPSTPSAVLLATCLLVGACAPRTPEAAVGAGEPPALKELFEDDFLIGGSLNTEQILEQDSVSVAIIKKHFNTITTENTLKWESVHPRPGEYDFRVPDAFVEFGERNDMFVVGHTLVWHNQTPRWVFEDAQGRPVSRDTLLARMRDHIHAVVGRYRGRIDGWDVVNEALNEDGTLRQSPWLQIIGEDYIAKAFQYAREADPSVELYYNDYSLENAPKREGAVRLVRGLLEQGVPVTGIGTQQHNKLDWPSAAQVDSTLSAFAALGVKVMVTELDVDVLPRATRSQGAEVTLSVAARDSLNPYVAGLPDEVQQELARKYGELFQVYLRHRDNLSRVTFWNVTDRESWLNSWPVRGRTAHPLLFDRSGRPKPAFHAVVRTARESEAGR